MKPNAQAQAMFDATPSSIKDDIIEALCWARDKLRDLEGAGHQFAITANRDMELSCSFAKPSDAGDHSGPYMDQDSHAVIMSVCTYVCGQ